MNSPTIDQAARLWDYLSSGRSHAACDAVVVCCSYDLRVCDYACEFLRRGVAPRLIITGNTGNWTKHLWNVPESHLFRARALEQGVAPATISIEDEATNFGENIAFVRRLYPELRRATFVTKPNSVLRVQLTAAVQWPELECWVDAPAVRFPAEASNVVGILGVIDEMVGDVDRILQYPARGFQAPHAFPAQVLEDWSALKEAGFTNHLLRGSA